MQTEEGKAAFHQFEGELGLTGTLARPGRAAGGESPGHPLYFFQRQEFFNRIDPGRRSQRIGQDKVHLGQRPHEQQDAADIDPLQGAA
jgi:hypothetical protein